MGKFFPNCTGFSASWCPVHGDCTCPEVDSFKDFDHKSHDDCPLHSRYSAHNEPDSWTPPLGWDRLGEIKRRERAQRAHDEWYPPHRRWAGGMCCTGCGLWEWEPENGCVGIEGWGHGFVMRLDPVTKLARERYPEQQRRSEVMALRIPFTHKAPLRLEGT